MRGADVVGRESELAAVTWLLDAVAEGPAVLALWGAAGIGKTTVWSAGVERARKSGFTPLVCQPTAAEVRFSYAGLVDLLAEAPEAVFERLPRPQRQALDAALLRGPVDDPAPDPRAVATGFLSVLDGLTQAAPVLVAVDDVQWLDDPTRRVVEFAVRRCRGPLVALVARRVDDRADPATELTPRDPGRRRVVRIGPLDLAALHQLLAQRTGRVVSRPVLVRVVERSGGNPLFALELVRTVESDTRGPEGLPPGLPQGLRSLMADRLAGLEPAARAALLVVSCSTDPRVDLVRRAVAGGAEVTDVLGQAEDAGVVELSGGKVRFTHPLLAAAVYDDATPTARRALHRRLSDLVDDVEERARHLALAAVGADRDTLAALEAAAAHARRRGAPTSAAGLLDHAMRLGANDPALQVRAAQDHFHAGDPAQARQLLTAGIDALPPGPLRAEALMLLATIRFDLDGDPDAVELLERAMDEAAGDPALRSSIVMELGYQVFSTRGPEAGRRLAFAAVAEAERLGDDGVLAEALAVLTSSRFFLGEVTDEATLARALALEDPDRRTRISRWPTFLAALVRQRSPRLDEARAGFAEVRQRCLDQGREGDLWFASFPAISLACWAGDLEAAERYVVELVEHAQLLGTDQAHALARGFQATLWAWVGRVDEAREAGEQAVASFAGGVVTFRQYAVGALGAVELSVGNPERAAGWLAPAVETSVALGVREPTLLPSVPDAVEALLALGRVDEAEPMVELLESSGRRADRHWARAVGARCRALLLTARGRTDDASEAFGLALTAHDEVQALRYDRARTLLALGQFQRRRNQRRAAQASLTEASRLFEEVGTAQWVRNARGELDRLGLHPGSSGELTPTEQHIAELTASGLTNREVATALFVSPKTVEAHLGRIYRKLGIRSRAELGRFMARRT